MAEEIAADYIAAVARVIEAVKPVLNQEVYSLTFDIGEIIFYVEGESDMRLVNHDETLWLRVGSEGK